MARQRRTLDDQIADLVTRGRTQRFQSLGVEGLAPIGSDHIEDDAINGDHIQENSIDRIALSPEVRESFDNLESGLRENEVIQEEMKERIKELKEVTLPSLDEELKAAEKRIADSVKNRVDPIDAGLKILEDYQLTVSEGITNLRDKALPALRVDLAAAQGRLDEADVLLNDSFPKRIAAAEGSASTAATRAADAEKAAKAAAADLVTAKSRADSAATAATKAAAEAEAAEASSARATGAAGVAEAAADTARQNAAAALTQAQNAGGNVSTAQAAAKAAQDAANTAKAQATTAGTAAAAADAKAAQAAADAAQAAADALESQTQATKSAGEAKTAKSEAAAAKVASAAAETAAATAKTRADTAATNATTAATKAAAAETSATKATGAAGVAETAADTARQNAQAALTQAQNSGSNASAAQAAADTAKAQATTAQTQATKAGTAAAAADAAAATAAAKAAQAAADLIVARNAAEDAKGTANTALTRADDALTAAGSTNKVLYSASPATGTANAGDTWRQVRTNGDVIAEWRYTTNKVWLPQKITSETISNLDVGKLTAGSGTFIQVVAERMAAATAAFQTVDIENLTVTGVSKMKTVVAEKVGAAVGEFVHIDIGTGTFGEMEGGRIKAGTVQAQHMLVGSFGNLIPNGAGEYGKAGAWSENLTWDANDKPAGENGSFKSKGGSAKGVWWDVEPNTQYKFDMWIKADKPNSVFFLEMRDQAGAHGTTAAAIPGTPSGASGGYPVGNYTVPTAWTKITSVLTTTATASKLRIAGLYYNHTNGTEKNATVALAGLRLVRRNDGSLIVNGSIIGDHVDARSVAGEIGTFVKIDVTNLTSTGKANMNEVAARKIAGDVGEFMELGVHQLVVTGKTSLKTATADQIFSDLFTTRKLYANQVVIGEGGNLFHDPNFLDSDNWTSGTFTKNGGRNGNNSWVINASPNQAGAYYGSNNRDVQFRVDGESTYEATVWARAASAVPAGGVAIYMKYTNPSTSASGEFTSPANGSNEKAMAANVWTPIKLRATVPATATQAFIGLFVQKNVEVRVAFSEPCVKELITPSLIVDGLMNGKRIVGASIETEETANRGVQITTKNGLEVFNSSGGVMLRANKNGVEAAGAFTADSQTGKVVMSGNIPGAAVPSRLEHGLQFYSASDALQGQIYSGYGYNGVNVRGPNSQTELSVGNTVISMTTPGGNVTVNNGNILLSGKTIKVSHGALDATRVPLGILWYWESSSQINIATGTLIASQTLTIPQGATIRITVHLRGYPTTTNQVTMFYCQAAGSTIGAHYVDTGVASYGADRTMAFTYNNKSTSDKAIAFRVLGTVAVGGSAARWTIPAKVAESQTEITIEDLGNLP